jgi:hypothetical protein
MTASTIPTTLPPISRARRIGFVAVASLLALFTGVAMGGMSALIATLTATGEEVIHQVHFLHWGAYMVVLIAVPLAALAIRRTLAPAQHVAISVGAFVVAAAAGQMLDPAVVVFPALIALLLFLHPERSRLLKAGEGFSPLLGMLAAVVTAPALWFAWSELQTHLAAPLSDPHRGPPEAHYLTGVAMALAIVGAAWLVAQRTSGWRVPAWCAGVAMALNGAVSIWRPDWVSSFGTGWGVAAVAWGAAFIAAAEVVARRGPR